MASEHQTLNSRVPPSLISLLLTVSDPRFPSSLTRPNLDLSNDWKVLEGDSLDECEALDWFHSIRAPHSSRGSFSKGTDPILWGGGEKTILKKKKEKGSQTDGFGGWFSSLKNPFKVSEKDAYKFFFFFRNSDLSSKEIKLKFKLDFLLSSCWFAAEPR